MRLDERPAVSAEKTLGRPQLDEASTPMYIEVSTVHGAHSILLTMEHERAPPVAAVFLVVFDQKVG